MDVTRPQQTGSDEEAQRAAALARTLMDEVPREPLAGLTSMPTRVLALIVLLEPRDRSVTEVSNTLGVAQSSASNIVDEAVAMGLVERCAHRMDHRTHVVRLTAKGHRVRRTRRGSGGGEKAGT